MSAPWISVEIGTRIGTIMLVILNHTKVRIPPTAAQEIAPTTCARSWPTPCDENQVAPLMLPMGMMPTTLPNQDGWPSPATTPFQPVPYSPVEKRPTASTPKRPLQPCTETAPTG